MPEVLGKIVSYIVLVLLVFIAPVVLILSKVETNKDNYIYNLTTKFVDDCSTSGQITPEEYAIFTNKIYSLGNYSIEIEHESQLIFAREDGVAEAGTVSTYMSQISEVMYADPLNEVPYNMKTGDTIGVSVKKNSSGILGVYYRFLLGREPKNELIVNYYMNVGETAE